ncbi:MAG: hypothetical protein O3C21_02545 [Verrucomicrobia bacterium]|nr:hypothetical protein [Verrucomicrobiota bacterium]
MPPGEARNQAITNAAATWARENPAKALEWARGLPPGDARRSSLNEVGWMWSQEDAPAGAAFALTLGADAEAGLLPQISQHWVGRDAAAAIAWGGQLPEGSARDQFLASAVGRMAQQDPKAAAAWLPQLPLAQQEAAAGQIARPLARSSPEVAARWAAQLPEDSNVRGNAYGQVLADYEN